MYFVLTDPRKKWSKLDGMSGTLKWKTSTSLRGSLKGAGLSHLVISRIWSLFSIQNKSQQLQMTVVGWDTCQSVSQTIRENKRHSSSNKLRRVYVTREFLSTLKAKSQLGHSHFSESSKMSVFAINNQGVQEETTKYGHASQCQNVMNMYAVFSRYV